jgi:hypothetical protein
MTLILTCKEALERMDIEEKRDLEDAKIDAR